MLVSVVLPCFNPPTNWAQIVQDRFLEFCDRTNTAAELILVIDGDATIEQKTLDGISKSIERTTVIRYAENRGKGYATRQGVAAAKGDIVIYTDIDFPYTTESMMGIYSLLHDNKCDIAAGIKNEDYYSHVPQVRRTISRFLQSLIKTFLSMPITDTQCGLKGFNGNGRNLFLRSVTDRYLFDLEFIYTAYHTPNLRVLPVPVALRENVHFRKMNYRILLPEAANFLRILLKRNK